MINLTYFYTGPIVVVGFEFTSATVAEGNTQRVCVQIQSGVALNSLYVQIFTVPHTATGKLKIV